MVGIVGLKIKATKVSLAAMLYTIIISYIAFNGTADLIKTQGFNGVYSAAQTMCVIFGAFTMLSVMRLSGAMDKINVTLSHVSNDKRVLLILIAFAFGAFIEGAAGAGTPAAIAAPFLVGLGFHPMSAVMASLISNGLPSSYGGAGLSTIVGTGGVVDVVPTMNASSTAGWLHLFGALIVPTMIILLLYGKKGLQGKGIKGFLLSIGATYGATLFVISNFVGPELVSMTTGVVTIIAVIIYVRLVKIETPIDFYVTKEKKAASDQTSVTIKEDKFSALQALSPYLILLIALPVIRFNVPLKILTVYGYPTWVGLVIFIVALIGAIILKSAKLIPESIKIAFKSIIPAFIAMGSLLVLANIMNKTGMMALIAKTLSAAGGFYPALSVFIGSLGAFMTGSTLGSNIMFAPLHVQAASLLNLNPSILVGSSSAGGALGNIICPNNVIAVATTVNLLGSEGEIIKKVLKPWFILALMYGGLSLLYSHILFPTYGM
jgi:lactate permease